MNEHIIDWVYVEVSQSMLLNKNLSASSLFWKWLQEVI